MPASQRRLRLRLRTINFTLFYLYFLRLGFASKTPFDSSFETKKKVGKSHLSDAKRLIFSQRNSYF